MKKRSDRLQPKRIGCYRLFYNTATGSSERFHELAPLRSIKTHSLKPPPTTATTKKEIIFFQFHRRFPRKITFSLWKVTQPTCQIQFLGWFRVFSIRLPDFNVARLIRLSTDLFVLNRGSKDFFQIKFQLVPNTVFDFFDFLK